MVKVDHVSVMDGMLQEVEVLKLCENLVYLIMKVAQVPSKEVSIRS